MIFWIKSPYNYPYMSYWFTINRVLMSSTKLHSFGYIIWCDYFTFLFVLCNNGDNYVFIFRTVVEFGKVLFLWVVWLLSSFVRIVLSLVYLFQVSITWNIIFSISKEAKHSTECNDFFCTTTGVVIVDTYTGINLSMFLLHHSSRELDYTDHTGISFPSSLFLCLYVSFLLQNTSVSVSLLWMHYSFRLYFNPDCSSSDFLRFQTIIWKPPSCLTYDYGIGGFDTPSFENNKIKSSNNVVRILSLCGRS